MTCHQDSERAQQLADDHWSYVSDVLAIPCEDVRTIDIIEFHYKSAFIHGHKHGMEDAEGEHKTTDLFQRGISFNQPLDCRGTDVPINGELGNPVCNGSGTGCSAQHGAQG